MKVTFGTGSIESFTCRSRREHALMSRHTSTGAGGIHMGLVPEEAQKMGIVGGRQKWSGKEADVPL